MKIAIIVGSIRKGRQSDKIARYLHKELKKSLGVSSQYLDLATISLPMLEDNWEVQDVLDANLAYMSKALAEADALLFVSPEYHGSYTGVLKNAVDHYQEEFIRKVIGVVSTGSGKFGGINASSHLQQLILSIGAYPMPRKLIIPFIQDAFDETAEPICEELQKECRGFLAEFLWFAQAISSAKSIDPNPNSA